MERKEYSWLIILIIIAVIFNALTISPLVPWQKWLLWSRPDPDKSYLIEFGENQIKLPESEISVNTDQYIEFVAVSSDVTYGLGVFDPDGPMLFQFQVLPGRENKFIWKFENPGSYTIRSTEYSGPKHSDMVIENAIKVSEQ